MGLLVHSLDNIPKDADRDYFIYWSMVGMNRLLLL